jgi:two-component system osmolarity sensor histidine kinase EnvZ
VRVRGYAVELDRALDNLLTNAVRYGRDTESGKLQVSVSLTVNADFAVVSVTDRGSGVPASEIDRLMRPFERGEAARSGSTGAGLGLPIVERVARMHGGDLQLSANAPHGLDAQMRLPLTSR